MNAPTYLHMPKRRNPARRQGWLARFAGQPLALLALECALLIALLTLVYLMQVAAVDAADSQLQSAQTQQTQLHRQDEQAHERLALVESPAYIQRRAIGLGLRPSTPGPVITLPDGSGR
ncbi:MAG TPA: hypothetical protein VKQ36_04715 [Ktedonobacterales bacterium]|nr:hypothetical protein [Ktedonobacterales bacterium]